MTKVFAIDRTRKLIRTLLIGLVVSLLGGQCLVLAGQDEESGLPSYRAETSYLKDVPGVSNSIAAGQFNPAAWSIQKAGGIYFGWRDQAQVAKDKKPWLFAYSNRRLGFTIQRFQNKTASGWRHFDEYTLGTSWGNWTTATGLSYSWNKNRGDQAVRHRRLTLGQISRWRLFSLGSATSIDLEKDDHTVQADLGLRPFGPRVTFFGDALYRRKDSLDDISAGFGFSAMPIPGLSIIGKMAGDRDPCDNYIWDYSIGIEIGLTTTTRIAGRLGYNDNGDHINTVYSIESGGSRPAITHGRLSTATSYPELDLGGEMPYRTYRFFDDRNTLLQTLHQINLCAESPAVGGVVLNLSGMQIGVEKLWELREQLAGLRSAGKKVFVYFEEAGMSSMMLASVADQIWIDPMGRLELPGICLGNTYYRNALDKAGIGVDEWRYFTYKSAMESLSRTAMSAPDREQRSALVDDYYDYIRETITTARGIEPRQWDSLVDNLGILSPSEALTAGLVDSIGTLDDLRRQTSSAPKRTTSDLSSFSLTGVAGDYLWEPHAWGEPDRIALLYAIGVCSMDSGIKARILSQRIRDAREDPRVKAVILRADSPGGDALASDLVARELQTTSEEKPVIVSQGQFAASGGYWISMYGDRIVASPLSITGSIGVAGMNFWDDGFGDKTGLTFDYVKRGEHADLFHGPRLPLINISLPARPFTDVEQDRAEVVIRDLYDRFVGKVAAGRSLSAQEVDRVGQGRIWSGLRGQEINLVDDLGGLWESIRLAKQAAGIPDSRRIKIFEQPQLGWLPLSDFSPSLIGVITKSTLRALFGEDRLFTQASSDNPKAEETTAESTATLVEDTLGPAAYGMLPVAERFYLEQMLRNSGSPIVMMPPLSLYSGNDSVLDDVTSYE